MDSRTLRIALQMSESAALPLDPERLMPWEMASAAERLGLRCCPSLRTVLQGLSLEFPAGLAEVSVEVS